MRGHLGGTGPHVRGHDVAHRAQHLLEAVHEGARGALALAGRQFLGIEVDAALGPAEGQVDQGGLPGHPRRERPDAVQIDVGVVPRAALVGAAGAVVLHAVGGQDAQAAIVHADRTCAAISRWDPASSRRRSSCRPMALAASAWAIVIVSSSVASGTAGS
jgi:hypothetical protein